MRIDWGGDDYAPSSDVYDGLRLRYFLHLQISLLNTPSPAIMSVGCQGRSSKSRMSSFIKKIGNQVTKICFLYRK
ncbi:hypothetical protein GNF10_14995 [Nostoc sp. UCD121]|uniref:hypothetical protein n=1 Tax=unclassified Nostoc TaxID=2593658 RepID=UPI00162848DB|nr:MULTISPECIES: hypothetical protein [unclassified Nostoc]MBC1222840.1 hypothetical protein [Nostoc sp. UCD120]MBC1277228.1 hypothetical protein [Nostoc sp. UCD121]MBC1293831.1 hypothetical protein [Nostoc sp. UCD122]